MLSKLEAGLSSRINLLGVWLLSKWQPACRRRDSDLGSYGELREPVVLMKRENFKGQEASRGRVPMQETGAE